MKALANHTVTYACDTTSKTWASIAVQQLGKPGNSSSNCRMIILQANCHTKRPEKPVAGQETKNRIRHRTRFLIEYPCWELNPSLSLRRAALYPLSYKSIFTLTGGEAGIRTLGAVLPAQPLSRRLRSSTPASPRTICLQGGGRGIRTPGNHKGYSGFQDRRLKPLGHPSVS